MISCMNQWMSIAAGLLVRAAVHDELHRADLYIVSAANGDLFFSIFFFFRLGSFVSYSPLLEDEAFMKRIGGILGTMQR